MTEIHVTLMEARLRQLIGERQQGNIRRIRRKVWRRVYLYPAIAWTLVALVVGLVFVAAVVSNAIDVVI